MWKILDGSYALFSMSMYSPGHGVNCQKMTWVSSDAIRAEARKARELGGLLGIGRGQPALLPPLVGEGWLPPSPAMESGER